MLSKELEEQSLVKNKYRTLKGGQKKIVLGGPKENEERKASRKAMRAFRKGGFRTSPSEKEFKQLFLRTRRQGEGS